ncbi:serine hydrolase [Actinomadura fulvescens]|uniref:Beta-lactamase class A catalytic domain-containing protein n=1 Tax=Actinomadura fulvescens TaxID=46160 RepID=A0ABN3QAG7_9ACTN
MGDRVSLAAAVRARPAAAALVIVLVATGGSSRPADAGSCCARPAGHSSADAAVLEPPAPAPAPPPSAGRRAPARPVLTGAARKKLTRSLERYLGGRSGTVSVAVTDLTTGLGYAFHGSRQVATASTVKVAILMALLLRAQRAKRALSPLERSLAAAMIKTSDNGAATTLWHMVGGSAGMASAYRRFGLRRTTPGNGDYWGSTTTTAIEQIRLLRALTLRTSPLNARNRRHVLELMASVAPEQAWGVSAAAVRGDTVALKNGWQPRKSDGGLYAINTMGRVRGAAHDFLIAVMTSRNVSSAAGIDTVERVAQLVTNALRKAGHV